VTTAQATAFDALRTPNFARLWAAQVISSFGDKITFFALAFVSWEVTGSALFTTLAFATSIFPLAIFGFFGGAVADAVGHRRAMVVCDLVRAALIGLIPALLAVQAPLPAIYALVIDPVSFLWVAALFVFIYQIEGHVVVPNVMANALRLHPLLVIFGLLAGGEIYGLPGILLALPLMAAVRALWEFFAERVSLEPWSGAGPVPVEVELESPVSRADDPLKAASS